MIADAAPRLPDAPYSASHRGAISVAPFRERFEACLAQRREWDQRRECWRDLTPEELAGQLALECGWTRPRGDGTVRPDTSRVLRVVGLQTDKGRHRKRISLETATVLCRAMGLAPHEVDL